MKEAQHVPPYSPLVQNGTFDWKNKPANKHSTGGIRACGFVLGELVGDRLAFDGVSASLVTYLTTQMGQATASASVKVNQWNGTAFLTSVLGGFVADAYLGRFHTILLFSSTFLLAMILLTLEVSVEQMKPCKGGGDECRALQEGFFYVAIYLAAVGAGGSKPCASAFGGDQFDEREGVHERQRKASFFNWWFVVQSSTNVIAVTLLVALQQSIGWGWGYGVPTVLLCLLLFLFAIAAPFYRYSPVLGSPLTQVARVLVVALRNSRTTLNDHCVLYEGDEIDLVKQGKVKMLHTNQFRCLDKAAIIPKKEKFEHETQGMSRWRLCSVTEVEEVKLIVRTLPIWLSLIPFSLATAQTHSLFIKQGSTVNRRVGTIEIPPASVAMFLNLTMVLFLPLYDRVLVPAVRKYTHIERGITLLQRIGVGIFIGIVGMATAALVERKRLNLAGGRPQSIEVQMSIFWLLPQYAILGLAQSFTSIGRLEFFYEQVPNSLRSLGTSMYLSSVGIANFLSSALIAIINRSTEPHPWIGRNLNSSHVDYFYWLLSALLFFELWAFLALSFWYRYKPNHHLDATL
ncbi:hypothetical protein GOP47_0010220 [Adiantum capillus-veneris]|uniref:Uncharacterized protein n=1 Tax=Adiantum capillus-veneris TaxID=13818 RepID=A0A9D4ZG72_ADICA|nr:hypothetical protein GOP47_0010220 [Adiantum capillus-veneris]